MPQVQQNCLLSYNNYSVCMTNNIHTTQCVNRIERRLRQKAAETHCLPAPYLIPAHSFAFSVLSFDRLVTRVVNTYGPQTRSGGGQGDGGEQQRGLTARDCGNAAIEERLHNMETHLKLPPGQRAENNAVSQRFCRLKSNPKCCRLLVSFHTQIKQFAVLATQSYYITCDCGCTEVSLETLYIV